MTLEGFVILFLTALALLYLAHRLKFFRLPPQWLVSRELKCKHVVIVFLIYIFANILLSPLLMLFLIKVVPEGSGFMAMDFMVMVSVLLSTSSVVLYCVTGPRFGLLRKIWRAVPRRKWFLPRYDDIIMGVVAWILSMPLVGLVVNSIMSVLIKTVGELPQEQVAVKHLKGLMNAPFLFWTSAFLAVTAVPFVEELLFRGFLQTILRRYCSRKKAVLVTAIIFAAFHFSFKQGLLNIQLLPALVILGWFLGYIYEKQRCLWSSIIMHAIFNFTNIVAMFLVDKS